MDIKCPHCGTEYEVGVEDSGRAQTCQICGKRFLVPHMVPVGRKTSGCFAKIVRFVIVMALVIVGLYFFYHVVVMGDLNPSMAESRVNAKTRNSNKKMAEGDVLEMYGRYYKKLDYYNLEEYLFNDGSECTELVLMDKSSGRTCQIVYDKRGEVFQWSQSIQKGFAEELLLERLRISKCEKR